MRATVFPPMLALLVACDSAPETQPEPKPVGEAIPLTRGETQLRIGQGADAAIMRSGPEVPVTLPRGFTLYPGAVVVSNTMVERGVRRRVLLVFESHDAVERIVAHYRAEARAAGASITLDLGGDDRASLGGALASGGDLTISARREGELTRVELSHG